MPGVLHCLLYNYALDFRVNPRSWTRLRPDRTLRTLRTLLDQFPLPPLIRG